MVVVEERARREDSVQECGAKTYSLYGCWVAIMNRPAAGWDSAVAAAAAVAAVAVVVAAAEAAAVVVVVVVAAAAVGSMHQLPIPLLYLGALTVEAPSAGPNRLVELGPKTDWPAGRFVDENITGFKVSNVGVAWGFEGCCRKVKKNSRQHGVVGSCRGRPDFLVQQKRGFLPQLVISKGLAKQQQIQAVALAIWPLLSSVEESFAFASFLAEKRTPLSGCLLPARVAKQQGTVRASSTHSQLLSAQVGPTGREAEPHRSKASPAPNNAQLLNRRTGLLTQSTWQRGSRCTYF